MAKKQPPKICHWCGTKLALRGCPRGPQCEADEREHESQMARIRAQDKAKKRG